MNFAKKSKNAYISVKKSLPGTRQGISSDFCSETVDTFLVCQDGTDRLVIDYCGYVSNLCQTGVSFHVRKQTGHLFILRRTFVQTVKQVTVIVKSFFPRSQYNTVRNFDDMRFLIKGLFRTV